VLYAEARDPRLDGHTVYRDSYSAQGLLDLVLREPERAWPSNRTTLWSRVLALFRIYDKGLPKFHEYEHIPPRGGTFFSETTPAGAILANAQLADAVVAVVIRDLGTTAPRAGVGRERVSFRELDIENLGAVYEGLLDHEPKIATETSFELTVGGRKYALSAEEVQRLCRVKSLRLRADDALVAGTPLASLARGEVPDDEPEEGEEPDDADDSEDVVDEEEDEPEAVKKGAVAKMVRRIEAGRFHFVPGAARKGSGSFYTPRPLVHDLVRHALDPVLEGRTPVEIESLRVLDPACGSGHFLVEAMRHMARALHRAYVETYDGKAPPEFRATLGEGWDTNWRASDEDARAANSEARAWCKRRIAERCLFGVDLNRTAVELARVALWIESLAGDRPLSYFEHHVRWGNSLVGSWMDALGRPPIPPKSAKDVTPTFGLMKLRVAIAEAADLRGLIQVPDPDALRREEIEPESVDEWEYKDRLRVRADSLIEGIRLLFDCRSASVFVPEIWKDWESLQTYVLRPDELRAVARKRPWWPRFEAVCQRERFFHWELEFPEVLLSRDRPGFDSVLGNPPWDKVLPTKHEFYAREDVLIRAFKGNDLEARIRELHKAHPRLADDFKAYQARAKVIAEFLRKSGDFPHSKARSAAAHEDVAKYFLDRAIRLVAQGGAVGFVVPSVVYNGDGCVGIRRALLTSGAIERFYGFANRRRIFPIDATLKFVSLVFRKGEAATGFDAAFARQDLQELLHESRPEWMVRVSRDEIARLSPETWAFLEYRGPRDQDIVRRMHEGCPTLGGREPGAWGVTLMSWRDHAAVFNTSEDKDLFTDTATDRLRTPRSVLGDEPADFGETIGQMRARGFWPVFEGKQIDQHVVGTKPVRWWLSVTQAETKYGRPPNATPTLVFRETAKNANERTCIAAILPAKSCGAHTLTGVSTGTVDPEHAAAVLNSMPFDFALRLRIAGTHVSFTYIEPMPVPDRTIVETFPAQPTQAAWEVGCTHLEQIPEVWPTLWATNRAVAEAYGLNSSDFEHILGSFPGFARKRPKLVAYFRERLAEWKSEEAASGVAGGRPWPRVLDAAAHAAEPGHPAARVADSGQEPSG
jgi:hypothetical protein